MSGYNWRAIRAIMRKDLKQVVGNKTVVLPTILVPLIILVLMPLAFTLLPQLVPTEDLDIDDMEAFFRVMPAYIAAGFEGLTPEQVWVQMSTNYMFGPMYLIVPMMVASIIAADSFVGERERKTLEALLYTPVSDMELFLGKTLVALVPAVTIGVASFVLCAIVVNAAGYAIMGRLFFPSPPWWPMVFLLGPAVSLVALGATVLISSKTKTFMQAQQLSGALVLPIVFLMIGQLTGLFFLGVGLMIAIGVVMLLIGLALVWIGARTFHRGELIARV